MADSLAALVLAAGAGTRLAPLTWLRPKALCPVAGVPLVDHSLAAVTPVVGAAAVAVNVHHGRGAMERHLSGRVHLSLEEGEALGTAGGVAHLRPWLDGRAVMVVNADTWHQADLGPFVASWDRTRPRVIVTAMGSPAPLAPASTVVASFLPPADVAALPAGPAGLFEECWRPAAAQDRLEVVGWDGPCFPCDRPRDYLAANLAASGGRPVVGAGAVVEGVLVRSVVWPGGVVRRGERLVDAVRAGAAVTVMAP